MNTLLKTIYDMLYDRQDSPELIAEIEVCHRQLIERLEKLERKLILQIIDNKDRIAEELSMDSFICGFQLGTRLATELDFHKRTHLLGSAQLKRCRDGHLAPKLNNNTKPGHGRELRFRSCLCFFFFLQ